jgi:ribosome-binding protein aMBF1 (putative translation factor)
MPARSTSRTSRSSPRATTRTPRISRDAAPRSTRVTRTALEKHKRQIPVRLAKIRADRSQRSFARELGVFQQNVNRYENGTTPHADFLITLAVQEGISLDWLLLGRGQPRSSRSEAR